MLTPGTLVYNAGRVRCTTSQPATAWNGGIPQTAAGLLCLVAGFPTSYDQGLGFVGAAVAVNIAAPAPNYFSQGLPFTAVHRLACDQVGAIASYANGLPFTAAGCLAIAAPE